MKIGSETDMPNSVNHSSDGPSWIDLAEIRVNTTESCFEVCLNDFCDKIGTFENADEQVEFLFIGVDRSAPGDRQGVDGASPSR